MSDNNNVMPNNLDAEQALLGCILIDNDIVPDVLDKLKEDDFYRESHQFILSAMKRVFAERKPIDIVTLSDKLETDGNLEKAGGVAYLTELTQVTPSSANYEHYFEIVRRDSVNRRLIRAAREIISYSQTSDDDTKSIQYAEELVYAVSRTNDTSTMKDIRESSGIDEVLSKFERLDKDKESFRGIQTGFIQLDKITNGLQKSDLIVIAARPGMGKTSLAMNIVENAALNHGKVCVVFSLEMPEIQIIQRLLCAYSGVSMATALAGDLNPNDWKKLTQASEHMRKCRLYIDDSSRVTPAEILSKCRRVKSKNNGQLDLIMIDYIQLMSSGKKNAEQNRTQEVADITRELKIMAKELDVPVIALSQLRRILGHEPELSDLRESGAIEQDADIVMFINRPDLAAASETKDAKRKGKQDEHEPETEEIEPDIAYLKIAKHRNGAQGRIKLRFKGELTKFVNPEPHENNIAGMRGKSRKNGGDGDESASEENESGIDGEDGAYVPDDSDAPFDNGEGSVTFSDDDTEQ